MKTKDGSAVPARLRIVGWMLFAVAIGLVAMVVSVRSTLLADVSRSANAEVTQEAQELHRFTEVGLDPQTNEPFTDAARLVEVYLGRQHLAAQEAIIVYSHGTGQATASWGSQAPQLDLSSTNPIFVQMLQQRAGAEPFGAGGEVRWARTDLQPDDPQQTISVLAVAFTEQQVAAVNRTAMLMAGIGLGVLGLTGAIGLLVAGQILRPLRDLRRAASSISEHDLTRRLPSSGRDDIAGLTESFNGMLDRLEDAFAGQSQFVLRAHRELGAPLERMDANLAGGPQTAQALAQRAEIAALVRMLEDLRVLAEAERSDFVRLHRKVDVDDLASSLAADLGTLGQSRWQVRVAASGLVSLDPRRVRQAVLQLGRNALQCGTPDADAGLILDVGPSVDARGITCIEFAVTDQGPGVPAEQVEWLFKRFTRGEVTGEGRGPGLGLAVVRAVADGHDGTVFVHSTPGHGATFGLRIPTRMDAETELSGAA